MRHLLDVNVWIAVLDEAHVFHREAHSFLQRRRVQIASCPLVENGVLRVLNLTSYGGIGPVGFEPVRAKLDWICTVLDHEFWPDDVSLRVAGTVDWRRVMGHNQITDVYLLALAVSRGGCLVTLDHRATRSAVPGAEPNHLLHL